MIWQNRIMADGGTPAPLATWATVERAIRQDGGDMVGALLQATGQLTVQRHEPFPEGIDGRRGLKSFVQDLSLGHLRPHMLTEEV